MTPNEAADLLRHGAMLAGYKNGKRMDEAIAMAVNALELQIPKKPIEGYVFDEWFREKLLKHDPEMANIKGSCCPSCGKHIGESEKILKKKNGFPFCKWCGQKINWEDEEG